MIDSNTGLPVVKGDFAFDSEDVGIRGRVYDCWDIGIR